MVRHYSGKVPLGSTRRQFLTTATAAAWPFINLRLGEAADRPARLSDYPFKLGVSSGDPAPDGFVLWTRLCPEPPGRGGLPHEDVRVEWQVATDEAMKQIVRKGVATAAVDWAHSVHVEIEGLEPDRSYWYQFKVGMDVSPVGRTRTAPAADAMLDNFRFAFASCQKYEDGYFTAYEHMAQDDLHAVVHLGDYIYEGAGNHGDAPARNFDAAEAMTLEDYRNRYALYRTDPHLQAAHAAFPWIVTWDDHEFANDCAGDISADPNVTAVEYLKRRAGAYQAYYENMPLRRSALPQGPDMMLYRRVTFGQMVNFSVLDTRQYRSDQPCETKYRTPCDGIYDPRATMLGDAQEKWLCKGLDASGARWNVLAQQVMMARPDFVYKPHKEGEITFCMDKWDGYHVPRTRLLQYLTDHQISNPVVLTGDVHCNWANDLKVDFDRPESETVATEFVGTSISTKGDGSEGKAVEEAVRGANPFVKFYNSERGYVRCELTADEWRSDYQTVPYVTRPGAPCITRATFVVENGRPGAIEA
ncbi:MAG: alkaline phosphatase D family protein [Planctomycetaceae bacterium]|jgi:alkaline phosphatase D